jgi:hypothetical protein
MLTISSCAFSSSSFVDVIKRTEVEEIQTLPVREFFFSSFDPTDFDSTDFDPTDFDPTDGRPSFTFRTRIVATTKLPATGPPNINGTLEVESVMFVDIVEICKGSDGKGSSK